MCLANHFRSASHMIGMRLAVEQDFGVIPTKAQCLHTRPYLRWRGSQVHINEDISFWRDDEVAAKILATHVVDVVSNSKWSDRSRLRGVYLSEDGGEPNKSSNRKGRKTRIVRNRHSLVPRTTKSSLPRFLSAARCADNRCFPKAKRLAAQGLCLRHYRRRAWEGSPNRRQ
jgi:hypothetical protein